MDYNLIHKPKFTEQTIEDYLTYLKTNKKFREKYKYKTDEDREQASRKKTVERTNELDQFQEVEVAEVD